MAFIDKYIVTNKVTLLAASYSPCVVYTITIIHRSVGEKLLTTVQWQRKICVTNKLTNIGDKTCLR